jgi:hypothetical protein
MTHICPRCNYETNLIANLKKHLQRKKPCEPKISSISCKEVLDKLLKPDEEGKHYTCTECGKKFATPQGKYQHKKHCKGISDCEEDEISQLREQIENSNEKIRQLEKMIQSGSQTNNNNTYNIGTQNNINIQINALGNEDISYMTNRPNFQAWFTQCIREKMDGILEYMSKKHLHDKHPENTNLRKMVKKDQFIETYNGKEWKSRFINDVLDEVFNHIKRDFDTFVEQAFRTEGKVINKRWVDNFMKEVGEALDFDIYVHDKYEYDQSLNDSTKEKIKKKIYKLACEYIYKHSKKTFTT